MPAMPETKHPAHIPPDTREELTVADIVRFFHRNWRLIFGTAALAGLGTALVLLLVVPKKYEASATLVIVPPRVSSDLKPQTLTVQSYQKILESDAVIAEAKSRLVRQSIWAADEPLRLGKELESRIFVSRRAEETTLAPMLQAVARGKTGDQAAAIANAWAAVFLERAHELVAGTTSATVQFVEQEYPEARDSLTKLEDTRVAAANHLQKRYDLSANVWDQRITAFRNETTGLLSVYEAETRRLKEEYSSQHNLDSRKAQLEAMRKAYSDLQDEQARVTSQLELKQLQLEAARKQLARTTPLVTLQKAITDDALWRSVADAKGGTPDWKALQGRSLTSQEVNAVYTALSAKVADIEMDVNAMVPRAATLAAGLERINTEMKALETNYRADDAGLEKLARERQSELEQLKAQRENQLAELSRAKQSELDGIKRETDTRLVQLDREIAQQREFFSYLAKNHNQALLAKAQENVEDARLGAPAVPPQTTEPRGLATKSLLAVVIGGVLGLGAGLVREA